MKEVALWAREQVISLSTLAIYGPGYMLGGKVHCSELSSSCGFFVCLFVFFFFTTSLNCASPAHDRERAIWFDYFLA